MTSSSPAPKISPAPLPPPSSIVPTITPASLSSLAIYNPSLGPTDETVHDQIVFYTSRSGNAATANDRLRQIGLAQGVVEFARGFSKTQNLSSVETEKTRIVTLEVEEPGWWILAQIDLTVIHNPTTYPPTIKYTAQEVSPPALLLADIRRAYDQFHFHYGSFATNLARLGRAAFCKRLEKYWLRWAWGRWEVVLHASPATAVFGDRGMKMAGGRAGKEIGSEERNFLKGWAEKEKGRGLVELVASRFGVPFEEKGEDVKGGEGQGGFWFWNGSARLSATAVASSPPSKGQQGHAVVMPQDGCIFPGTGALDCNSIRDVAIYLSELYQYGDESSSRRSASARRRKGRDRPKGLAGGGHPVESSSRKGPAVTGPAGGVVEVAVANTIPVSAEESRVEGAPAQAVQGAPDKPASSGSTNAKILNLLTFGWSGGALSARSGRAKAADSSASSPGPSSRTPSPSPMKITTPQSLEQTAGPVGKQKEESKKSKRARFVIGFLGDLDVEDLDETESGGIITSRTIWATRKSKAQVDATARGGLMGIDGGVPAITRADLEEFRVVVYTNHPFILAFIFESSTPHLTSPSFYRTIHHQLAPLHERMLKFSPLESAAKQLIQCPGLPSPIPKPPYDLLYNPNTKEIHCTLPPIPQPAPESSSASSRWTRADAFHAHSLILAMLSETTADQSERERNARSTKGWWINWMRFDGGEEGIVMRRAGEREVVGADMAAGLVSGSGVPAGKGVGAMDVRNYFGGLVRGNK